MEHTLIIDTAMLKRFNACQDATEEFQSRFPGGLDISGLWRDKDERAETWRRILGDEFLRRYVGWGIWMGLLPSRIDADLRGVDLRDADLRDADLRDVDLRGANLIDADLRDARICKHTLGLSDEQKAQCSLVGD